MSTPRTFGYRVGASGLPRITLEELQAIPRTAVIALAARCARRALPFYRRFWEQAPAEHVGALEYAISAAEGVATTGQTGSLANLSEAEEAASAIMTAIAKRHLGPSHGGGDPAKTARFPADSAVQALMAASSRAEWAQHALASIDSVLQAYGLTPGGEFVGDALTDAYGDQADTAARIDYETLRACAEREQWTDSTPVPPAFFGPLWPDGGPRGWPVQESESEHQSPELILEIDAPDTLTAAETMARVAELVESLDGVHRAFGGNGLRVANVEVLVDAGSPVGAPS